MTVLFFMRSTVYVRNFESTLRLLAERGHRVHVVADAHRQLDPSDLMGRLCGQYPGITHGAPPTRSLDVASTLGRELRHALDYLRYLQPEYKDAPKLRRRAALKAPAFVLAAVRNPAVDTRFGRRLLATVLRVLERGVRRDPLIDAFLETHRPDLVLVTPLVEPGSPQSDYLRSARALGVRTGLCVYSWDNLTNKGLVHDVPDVVTVWNQAMKAEAVSLHRLPAERVVVTGAAAYDHWFGWQPTTSREEWCQRIGLDPTRPYLLYLCSSKFIAPDEASYVKRWIQDIRASSPTLSAVGVLVRPHPQNTAIWRDAVVDDLPNVAVWPRAGGNPVDTPSRAEYFDSIFHSAAVVGVNTSSQIESAIVGRGVHTLLAAEFEETQQGTLHFRHLQEVNGGLLHVASTLAEHVRQLEEAIRHPEEAASRCRRFVESFVRPCGLEEPAAPRLVAVLEDTAARGAARPYPGPAWAPLVRPLLDMVARRLDAIERAHGRGRTRSRRRVATGERLHGDGR